MRRSAVLFSLAVLALVQNAGAEDKNTDFTGTWILNVEESDLYPKPAGIMNMGGSPVSVSRGGGMGSGGYSVSIPIRGMRSQQQDPNAPLVIEQTGNELKIITRMNINVQQTLMVDHYILDGEKREKTVQIPDAPEEVKQTIKASMKKRKITLEIKTPYPQGESTLIYEFSLSKDGGTLKLEISNRTLVLGGSSTPTIWTVQKQVYNKQ
ncbi:MAG: hypothetical protein JXR49_06295 [Acidobacteria bacterium]|nr:hypothetical protein [Acidobacteriota bacterium]